MRMRCQLHRLLGCSVLYLRVWVGAGERRPSTRAARGYYHDDPWMAPTFADLRSPSSLARVLEMPNFYAQVANGTLPQYTLIQPRMATSATGPSNWQHPDGSVAQGEVLTATIYEALRSSAYWEKTLFIITYDEHGGFYGA